MSNFRGSFELDPIAARLVEDGVITISVVFTRDGVDTWARACDRHPRLGISPSDSILLKDLPEVFAKHRSISEMGGTKPRDNRVLSPTASSFPGEGPLTPSSGKTFTSSFPVAADRILSKMGLDHFSDDLEVYRQMVRTLSAQSVDSCRQIIRHDALDHTKINGVSNLLPKDSLTRVDLERNAPLHVFARFVAVAAELGNDKLVSRIRTSSTLRMPGVADLPTWWLNATLEDKLVLLSSNKKMNVTRTLAGLTEKRKSLLAGLPHPFRGAAEKMVLETPPSPVSYETDEE